jgi:hypothetical protein
VKFDLPAREMVADMLRLSGRSDDAIQQYRFSLQADPDRFSTLLHAAETAENRSSGNPATLIVAKAILASRINAPAYPFYLG